MKGGRLRGHLDGLILAVLEPGPLHGYALMDALSRRSGGALELPTGTVYPALRRLERAGYLVGEWSTVGGRQRRTYRLSRAGRRLLADERAEWRELSDVIETVLRPRPAGG